MTRTVSLPTLDRRLLALALVPLALAACGEGKKPSPRAAVATATAGATTPAPAATVTTQPAAPTVVSYGDAESVYRSRDYRTAESRFEAYTATKPNDAHGHYMLGLAAWKAGDPARAERAFDRALELDPQMTKGWLNSARVLLDLGRPREALERVQVALDRDSTSADALRLLARTQAQLGETDAALDSYERVLVANDRDVWAMNNLGLLYLEMDQPETALPPLARAVQLRPTAPVFQNNLGMALERTGNLVAAKRAYEAALKADSGYAKAQTSLARVAALIDSTAEDTTDVGTLAETFRLQVRMWQDGARVPDVAPETKVEIVPDSVPADTTSPDSTKADSTTEAHDGC